MSSSSLSNNNKEIKISQKEQKLLYKNNCLMLNSVIDILPIMVVSKPKNFLSFIYNIFFLSKKKC